MASIPRSVPPKLLLVAGFVLGIALAACTALPRTVDGLPDPSAWESLPLSDWLAEDRAEPEAVALCETCGAGMTVGIVRLSGPSAREAEAELRDPQRLVRLLEARDSQGDAPARAPPGRSWSSPRPVPSRRPGHPGSFSPCGARTEPNPRCRERLSAGRTGTASRSCW